MSRVIAVFALALGFLAALPQGSARAQGSVVVYCSVLIDWCNLMAAEFERTTGIKVIITQKGSGETFAQIRAEAANPRGDIWWGGTGDPHLQAAELGLTEEYRSPSLPKLHAWARKQAEQSGYRTVGIYAGALGFVAPLTGLTVLVAVVAAVLATPRARAAVGRVSRVGLARARPLRRSCGPSPRRRTRGRAAARTSRAARPDRPG